MRKNIYFFILGFAMGSISCTDTSHPPPSGQIMLSGPITLKNSKTQLVVVTNSHDSEILHVKDVANYLPKGWIIDTHLFSLEPSKSNVIEIIEGESCDVPIGYFSGRDCEKLSLDPSYRMGRIICGGIVIKSTGGCGVVDIYKPFTSE